MPGRFCVLHVMLNPLTGPWAVMKQLAAGQSASGRYAGVGFGLITDRGWPQEYESELRDLHLPAYRHRTPRMFGTASALYQWLRRPPLGRWAGEFAAQRGAEAVILHCHNAWVAGSYLPVRAPRGVRLATVVTFHGVNSRFGGQPVRHRIHRWFARRTLACGTRLTSVDRSNLDLAEGILGLPRDAFTVIPNGVPERGLSGCPFARGGEVFTVGHVGSLIPQKGWHIAAEAVCALAARGRRVRMLIAGRGPDEEAVREQARAHPGVIEYRGFVSDPQANIMPELDLLALLSVQEGLPMAIVEALSVGVPVAATEVGGIPEVLTHGETGFLVRRTSEALAEVIEGLLASRERLLSLSRNAHAAFERRFALGAVLDQYHQLYCEALS